MKFQFKHTAIVAAGLLTFASHAQTVSQFYSVGDSLSDPGVYAPTTQLGVPGSGRFTTNPGLVWTQYLGQYLGLPSNAAVVNQFGAASRTPNGGTNYAQGGSRVSQNPGVGVTSGAWFTADPVSTQVDRLLLSTGGRIDSKALVSVWAGANDIFTQYGAVGVGLPVATAITNVNTAAADLTSQILRLKAAGAQFIIVNSLPDIGRTPFGASQGVAGQALLSSMSSSFNQQLLASTASTNVLVIDTNRLLTDITARPAAYGFTSATALTLPVCSGSSLTCVNPAGAGTSVFADGVHPTSATHQIFAQVTLSALRAPYQIASIASTSMNAARQHAQAQESQLSGEALLQASDADGNAVARQRGDIQMYTGLQTSSLDVSTNGLQLGNNSKSTSALVGGDYMVKQDWLVGLTLSHAKSDVNFSQNSGGYKSALTAASAYSTLALTPQWFVNAAIGYGSFNFDSVTRDSYLGVANLLDRAQGSSSGSYTSLRAGGGYLLRSGAFTGGPTFDITQQNLRVNAYTENASVTSLAFGNVNYNTMRASLGFNGNYKLNQVQLFGRVSLAQDLKSDPLTVSVGSSSTNSVAVQTDRPDRRLVSATMGVKGQLNKTLQWSVFGNQSSSQSATKGWALGAGLKLAF